MGLGASKASNLLPWYFKYDAGNNQSKMPRTFGGDGVPPLTDKPGTPKIRLGKQMVMRWGAININGGYSGKKVELAEAASKMGLDVLAVSDIRVRGEKEEEVGEYKVYLSGVKAGIAQWRAGLYIRKEMEPSIVAIRYVNERLMWIDWTVSSKKIRIVSVYSHCEGTGQDKMDSFYEALSDVVVRVKDKDSVLLMGDFNARIGNRTEGYEKVMGKFGEDMEANRNGKQLFDFCASMGLVITNSFFKHKNIHRYTWEGRGTRSVIDYIITDQEFRKAVRDTRVFRGFFDDTDHYLICSEIGIVRPKVQETGKLIDLKNACVQLNSDDLESPQKYSDENNKYIIELEQSLECMEQDSKKEKFLIDSRTQGLIWVMLCQ
ncbi:craniofacial development protein 2-like [Schistocerca cancellata]|uniref:craniofacial development protein 2-like n=1 Tax=Schistocerca cancellata TaxID=274614 RepID=UPI0021172D98|nr:craniofacial development protein 2-like [Schistocerca cancellata]